MLYTGLQIATQPSVANLLRSLLLILLLTARAAG